MSDTVSVQDRFAPTLACFGCGPANEQGLRIKSHEEGEGLVAEWTPEKHHEAFPGVLNGGIVGALLDCHGNWTACIRLMHDRRLDHPPCTVTAEYSIKLRRPTPTDGPLRIVSRVVEAEGDKVVVEASLASLAKPDKLTSTMRGTFIAVQEGHPAYHRW